jgi:membrane associated rhomboid family serine protease
MHRSPFALTPWVRGLIIANAVVYLLTITVFTGAWVVEVSAFSPTQVGTRLWTFVTYMFVHGGFLHLLFNMIMLFFFGPAVEERMGSPSFALYYFTCGFGGAVLSLVLALATPVAPFIGASAAVLGVTLAFAMYWPDMPVYVFPLPFPVKVKWLVAFLAITNLLFVGANDGVARLAHLGGLLFGFIYVKSEERLSRRTQAIVRQQRSQRTRAPAPRRQPSPAGRSQKAGSDVHSIYDDIDLVLDKISKTGLSSLTPEERRLLDQRSRELRKH